MLDQYSELSGEQEKSSCNFEFEQKLGEVNLDQEQYSKITRDVDHFRGLVWEKFDSDNREYIQSALLQMLELHKDQKDRPDGMPYISHPLEVSKAIVQDFGVTDKDLVKAALLHDAVEDQAIKIAGNELADKYGPKALNDLTFIEEKQDEIRELAFGELEKTYGAKVVSILRKLTNPDFDSIASKEVDPKDKEVFATKKNELYKDHVGEVISDEDTLVIKLADFIHNTSNASQLPESPQKNKYRMKYMPVIKVFIDRLQREDMPCPIADKQAIISKLNSIGEKLSK